jgi:hypothetical protein
MDTAAAAGMGGMMLVLMVLAVVLVIAWILLPFAMFGMKPLLRDLIRETKRTNDLLEAGVKTRDVAGQQAVDIAGKS